MANEQTQRPPLPMRSLLAQVGIVGQVPEVRAMSDVPLLTIGQQAKVRALVARIARWKHCMSYNDSYFTEPRGMLKGVMNELQHVLDLNSEDYDEWVDRDQQTDKTPR